MDALIIATRNAHKAAEIRTILGDQFRYLTLQDFPGAPAVEEDAGTFAGNATKKAVELARWLANPAAPSHRDRMFVLADDSGLEVDALDGAPGVHSARFAAVETGQSGNSSDGANLARLLELLKDVPAEKRAGRFRCVLALTPVCSARLESASPACYADEFELATELFEGVCEGTIAFSPSGGGGFGYDPVFIPAGQKRSFAELGEELKNRISHRARALEGLRQRCGARAEAK
jgi:XTP/dITP diphosphohydrolase